MRRFWQEQRTVAVEGVLSSFAVENTATKPAKTSLHDTTSPNQTKKQLQTECLL